LIRGRRRGVSTVIGAVIFLLIFAVAMTAMLAWAQSYASYVDVVREDQEFQNLRMMEELSLSFLNSSGKLLVEAGNPTPRMIIITQVWSNHTVQTGEWAVPAKTRVPINTDLSYAGMTASKVVTSRGNLFSGAQSTTGEDGIGGTGLSIIDIIEAGRWYVQWYNLSSRRVFDMKLGESYWETTSLTFQWGAASNDPVFGPYTKVGFNATTRLVALNTTMYINYYVNEDCRIILPELGIDTGWNNGTGYVEASVSPGGIYTVTVLYSRWTGAPFLTLNFVNADFVNLLKGT